MRQVLIYSKRHRFNYSIASLQTESEAVTVHKVSTQHPGQWPQGATAVITVAVGLYTAAAEDVKLLELLL